MGEETNRHIEATFRVWLDGAAVTVGRANNGGFIVSWGDSFGEHSTVIANLPELLERLIGLMGYNQAYTRQINILSRVMNPIGLIELDAAIEVIEMQRQLFQKTQAMVDKIESGEK